MKKIFAFVLACFVMLGAADLKIGTEPTFPPFEYLDDHNKIVGFDVDLVDELAKRVGFSYEFVQMNFDGLISALKAGKINVIVSGMSATDARRRSIDFTDSYFATENLFLRKKGNTEISSKDSLKGKRLGVQQGSIQEIAANAIARAKVLPFENSVTVATSLKAGKIDAMIVDTSVGYGFLKKNPDLEEFLKEPDGSDGFAIAFDKDKNIELIAKINAALAEIKKDGTYDKLLEKYDLK
ncbi:MULTISPECIES: basic amino acid ABC transporter substrate-binding protein [unclassified Campylobacter]|uniref:basic amino acid ABC transporter substrate-binding protein n=1 Tax=unclassified Campylobacter TaxID=2593542 RepID=UPI003D33E3EE